MRLLAFAPLLAACYDPALGGDAGSGVPSNDLPATPLVLAAGTSTVSVDVAGASDQSGATPCSEAGMNDLYFQFDQPEAEVVLFDTSRSTPVTFLELSSGPCTNPAFLTCGADCGRSQQIAKGLTVGTYCLAVEVPAGSTGKAVLDITHAHWTDDSGPPMVSGDARSDSTCSASNDLVAPCPGSQPPAGDGPEQEQPFALCPGMWQVTASTCGMSATDYDLLLYVSQTTPADTAVLGCNDDYCGGYFPELSMTIEGPGLYWIMIDSWSTDACGAYTLQFTADPI